MPENWHPGLETHAATDPASTPVSNAAPKQRPPRKPHTTTHRHIEWDVDPDMVLRDADVNSSSFGRPRIGIARTADPLARYRGTGSVMKALATGLPVAALILGAVLALDHLNRAHRNQLKHPSTNRHIP